MEGNISVYMNRRLYDNVPLLELLDFILDLNGDSFIRQVFI